METITFLGRSACDCHADRDRDDCRDKCCDGNRDACLIDDEPTDPTGALRQAYVYGAFGNIESQLDPNFVQPFTITSREFDEESDFYFYRARYYDPTLGRFLQEDRVAGSMTAPQSLNSYPYVLNNPLNFVDPFGLTAECLGGAFGSFRNCMKRGGIATGFSTGAYIAACGILGAVSFGGGTIPCVAAVSKISAFVLGVQFTICYFDYLDKRKKCENEDGCKGPSLGPIPIPAPPSCGICNSDLRR